MGCLVSEEPLQSEKDCPELRVLLDTADLAYLDRG